MSRKDKQIIMGTVEKIERNEILVKLDIGNNPVVKSHISGNMRRRRIKIVVGDKVQLEISETSPDRGIIVYRGVRPTRTEVSS